MLKAFGRRTAVIFSLVILLAPSYIPFQPEIEDKITDVEFTINDIDVTKLGNVGVPFIENQGQADEIIKFYAKTFAGAVLVTENDLVYSIPTETIDGESAIYVIKEKFLGEPLDPQALEKSITKMNYFYGEEEFTNIPTYASISLGEVWPSVLLKSKAYANNIEKIFEVQPGGNVSDIKVSFEGVDDLTILSDGRLLVIIFLLLLFFSVFYDLSRQLFFFLISLLWPSVV